MQTDICERLAKIERVTNTLRSDSFETLRAAYKAACDRADATEAAAFARKIRDKMLEESDKRMALDRLGLDTSTAPKFIASLAKIFGGDWAKYRQALRDLPQQEGFPFDIRFPTYPGQEEENQPMR